MRFRTSRQNERHVRRSIPVVLNRVLLEWLVVLETIASVERPTNLGANEHGIVLHDVEGFRDDRACGRSNCVGAVPEPLRTSSTNRRAPWSRAAAPRLARRAPVGCTNSICITTAVYRSIPKRCRGLRRMWRAMTLPFSRPFGATKSGKPTQTATRRKSENRALLVGEVLDHTQRVANGG